MLTRLKMEIGSVQPQYLLSSGEGVVKAGHIGHDRSLIWLGGVDDIYGIEREVAEGGKMYLLILFCTDI